MSQDPLDNQGDPYDVVSLRPTWSGLSLFFLFLQLPMPYLISALPWRPNPIWLWPLIKPAAHFGLSILGFVCGLLGWRSGGRGSARLGVLLNGVVLALMGLWVLGMMWIVAGRR